MASVKFKRALKKNCGPKFWHGWRGGAGGVGRNFGVGGSSL